MSCMSKLCERAWDIRSFVYKNEIFISWREAMRESIRSFICFGMDEITFLFLILIVCLLCVRTSRHRDIMPHLLLYGVSCCLDTYIRIRLNWQYFVWLVSAVIRHAWKKNGTINSVSIASAASAAHLLSGMAAGYHRRAGTYLQPLPCTTNDSIHAHAPAFGTPFEKKELSNSISFFWKSDPTLQLC